MARLPRRLAFAPRRRRPFRRVAAGVAVSLAATTLAACSTTHASAPPSPAGVVAGYLSAWSHRDWAAAARLALDPPASFARANLAAITTLQSTAEQYSAGKIRVRTDRASVPITERLELPVVGSFEVHSTLDLVYRHRHWRVEWTPATTNPAFGADGHYTVSTSWPQRADILAADGTSLTGSTTPTAVSIGVEGYAVKDPAAVSSALVQAGATSSEVASALALAHSSPNAFEPVFTVSWDRYQQLKPVLYPVPGVFFQSQGGSGSGNGTPPDLAAVVGTVGLVTKSELKALGPPYTASSMVGQGGLEQSFERQLAGRPGTTISAVRAPIGSSGPTTVLRTIPPVPGRPVRTTILPQVQQAAATALATAPNEAALVAIDAPTGQIIAAANNSSVGDLALEGAQPPGSTMKVVTSTALIAKGLTPQSPASCPPVINVDGENLHNDGAEGAVANLFQAFTVSCNTAFIGLTMANLDYSSLHAAALGYRIGTPLHIGLPTFSGSVPVNVGQTDLAASAIGQSRVVMNPLDLAMIAGDVATSTVRTPYVTSEAAAATAPTSPLSPVLISDLHEMMLSVVESGTAAGTGLPPDTYAKTGTAEYGATAPLHIDAWLMGFHGRIAFAMLDVDAPGDGGPTDGPVVARFLNAVGSAG